jgi:tRNA (guanosine-2'-O-)-methyltransferase
MSPRKRRRADGSPAPRSRRTLKPLPSAADLEALEALTDGLPEPLRAFRDRNILNPVRRFRLEEALRHRTRSLVVVLYSVDDPHNQAAVMRTSEALGLQEVHVVGKDQAAEFRPSPRVTQNAHRWLDVVAHPNFTAAEEHLRSRGFELLAAALGPDAKSVVDLDFTRSVALVFGNESEGLPREILHACDGTFTIPLYGLSQSLNISVAAAVTLSWAIESRRRAWGEPGDLEPKEKMRLRRRFYATAAHGNIPEDLCEQLDRLP